MKTLKNILIAFMALATLVACKGDDDNNDNTFLLSNSNLAGSHNLTFFNANVEITTEFQGIPVTATTTVVGDTFQVTFDFADNGTYVVDGQYRITTSTTVAGQTETDTEILVLDNETGTYTVDANAQTITLSNLGETGVVEATTFDVTLFNESEIRLVSTEVQNQQGITTDSTLEVRLVRQ